MSEPVPELRDTWEVIGGHMRAAGDKSIIDDWLATKLEWVQDGDWRVLYRHKETRLFWELTWPDIHMQGGGPRLLRRLDIANPDQWLSS